jgi:hypothetical protein
VRDRARIRFHFECCRFSYGGAHCTGHQMRAGFFAANILCWALILVVFKLLWEGG